MLKMKRTCYACPEQYEAEKDGETVAYLRLRHGNFTVQCPDVGGTLVYDANPLGDGIFNEEEREKFLLAAVEAIYRHYGWGDYPEYLIS